MPSGNIAVSSGYQTCYNTYRPFFIDPRGSTSRLAYDWRGIAWASKEFLQHSIEVEAELVRLCHKFIPRASAEGQSWHQPRAGFLVARPSSLGRPILAFLLTLETSLFRRYNSLKYTSPLRPAFGVGWRSLTRGGWDHHMHKVTRSCMALCRLCSRTLIRFLSWRRCGCVFGLKSHGVPAKGSDGFMHERRSRRSCVGL